MTVEGFPLDESLRERRKFCSFFSSAKLQVDVSNRRDNVGAVTLEWSCSTCPNSAAAESIQFKIFSDARTIPVRLFLVRNTTVRTRYTLSDSLRDFLPGLRVDPTEEEVLFAVWLHVQRNGLVEGKERKVIKLDDALRGALFNGAATAPSLHVSHLRGRVLEQLRQCDALEFDYFLADASVTASSSSTTAAASSADSTASSKRFDCVDTAITITVIS